MRQVLWIGRQHLCPFRIDVFISVGVRRPIRYVWSKLRLALAISCVLDKYTAQINIWSAIENAPSFKGPHRAVPDHLDRSAVIYCDLRAAIPGICEVNLACLKQL